MTSDPGNINVRQATPDDAAGCADILNDWIDGCEWMPRVHDHADVRRHYREFVFKNRMIWVAGKPPVGYLALDEENQFVTSLFVRNRGRGIGKTLLGKAREKRDTLNLWTFVANQGARRFYEREDFREVRRTEGENEENLADVLLRWERTPVQITKAVSADLSACADVINAYVDQTDWLPRTLSHDAMEALFSPDLLSKREVYVAKQSNKVLGYITIDADTGKVPGLYLAPCQRNGGVGKRLLDKAKACCPTGFELTVFKPNEAAQKFYLREGLIEVPEKHLPADKTEEGVGQLTMRWEAAA